MAEPLHFDGQPPEGPAAKIRFGPYEADLRAGVLRKHDIRIRLAEQPFRILARLVRSPGELVTREELIELLWPDGTYVEFDHSLNAAVKKLRRALNDSPTAPRFVQTLPKKGYRFVAAVEVTAETAPAPPEEIIEATEPATERAGAAADALPSVPLPNAGYDFTRIGVLAAGIVITLGLLVLLREFGSNGGFTSVEAGPVRLEARSLEDFAERQWMLPSISPDGTSLAFSWNGGEESEDPDNMDIYVQRLDGGPPVRVTTAPGRDLEPAWSPDGLRIATWRQWPAPASGTFVVSLRDGSETKVMEATGAGGASWTPDGQWLVAPEDGGIVAVSIETQERREIVKYRAGALSFARVSPDGQSLAFVHCPSRQSCDLFLQPWEGGEPRQLTVHKGAFGGVAWTPMSDSIVYSTDGRLYRVWIDGNRSPQLIDFLAPGPLPGRINSPTIARYPTSGSTRMLFLHSPVRDADIWETDISADSQAHSTGFSRKLVDSPGLDSRPAYSPDGRSIAFQCREGRDHHLCISDRDGSNRRQLTDSTYRLGNVCPPAWSPDGNQIAFRASTLSDKAFHIYTMSVEGGVPRRVTSGEAENAPAWSRDGLWIYFLSTRSGKNEVWKTPSDGRGPATPVSGMRAWSFAESPDGRFVYFCGNAPPAVPYGGLYRVRPQGGPAEKLLEPFSFSYLEFRGDGLYFLDRGLKEVRGSPIPLKRLDVRTMEITEGARVKLSRVFSLSPDGRSILTSEMGKAKFELMLVEDFR